MALRAPGGFWRSANRSLEAGRKGEIWKTLRAGLGAHLSSRRGGGQGTRPLLWGRCVCFAGFNRARMPRAAGLGRFAANFVRTCQLPPPRLPRVRCWMAAKPKGMRAPRPQGPHAEEVEKELVQPLATQSLTKPTGDPSQTAFIPRLEQSLNP